MSSTEHVQQQWLAPSRLKNTRLQSDMFQHAHTRTCYCESETSPPTRLQYNISKIQFCTHYKCHAHSSCPLLINNFAQGRQIYNVHSVWIRKGVCFICVGKTIILNNFQQYFRNQTNNDHMIKYDQIMIKYHKTMI